MCLFELRLQNIGLNLGYPKETFFLHTYINYNIDTRKRVYSIVQEKKII